MIRISFLTTGLLAFAITAISGFALIPWLRKVKFGQTIKEIGPTWHRSKQGTPTMGGLMFYLGSIVAICAGLALVMKELQAITGVVYTTQIISLVISMLTALGFGFIVFVDDYIKVVKKRNLGLTGKQKLVLQFFVTAAFLIAQYLIGHINTTVNIPIIGTIALGVFYYPLVFAGIIFMVQGIMYVKESHLTTDNIVAFEDVYTDEVDHFMATSLYNEYALYSYLTTSENE